MKYLSLFVSIIIISSCGDALNIDIPSTYQATDVEILEVTAYRYTNGQYEEIPLAEAGQPNTSGMTGGGDILELLTDSELVFDDGFGKQTLQYETADGNLRFISNGSAYDLQTSADGTTLLSRRVGGGEFDDANPFTTVSATCEDEGCEDVNPSGYLFSSTEGTVGYIIIYNEVFTKQ